MLSRRYRFALLAAFLLGLVVPNIVRAEEEKKAESSKFAKLTEKLTKSDGLWTTYSNDERLLVEVKSSQLDKDFIIVTSISQGVGVGNVIGGMSWGFGDDAIWAFKKVGEKIHLVQRNVRFRAKKGSPEADAVKIAYSDSVLYALPILTKSPAGGHLVDMTRVFMSDDQGIGQSLGFGARFSRDRSTFAKVKAYPENVEFRINAVYSGAGGYTTIANPRGVQVGVHYSLRMLPKNGYRPRVADDRIGYFLTVIKDFSETPGDEQFVRYINRWDLQKADPKIDLSPPKKPIVFYMEKTIPIELRPSVRAGILEWNKAFKKIGFDGAIEVRQQQASDNWDPEDIRYNTFRWITSDAGFAMGPSRVNPKTGEILDADIIFDAGFLDSWRTKYETFSDEVAMSLMPAFSGSPSAHAHGRNHSCRMCQGMQHQFGFAAAALIGRGDVRMSGELPKKLVHEGLKEVVMHEVGHTLGLRHNFKASSWKPLADITAPDYDGPVVASVMDYAPANIVPKEEDQGYYYSQTLGPYDEWAISYGYSHLDKSEEKKGLAKIASKSTEPGLAFATDEDTYMSNSDPLTNLWDLGDKPIEYAERQMKIARELMPDVVGRTLEDGDSYARARQAFGLLVGEYFRSSLFAARFPGGVYVSRDHYDAEDFEKGDALPFEVVSAEDQRAAMKLLVDNVFTVPAPDAKTLNALAPTRWSHWGSGGGGRGDYALHDQFGRLQSMVLGQLLNRSTLDRLLDNEFKTDEPYTLSEHLRTVVEGVFGDIMDKEAEGDFAIDSFRRNLQRSALTTFSGMLTDGGKSSDVDALTRMHLTRLQRAIGKRLKGDGEIDDITLAHLLDMQRTIKQVLNAEMTVSSGRGGGMLFFGRPVE